MLELEPTDITNCCFCIMIMIKCDQMLVDWGHAVFIYQLCLLCAPHSLSFNVQMHSEQTNGT